MNQNQKIQDLDLDRIVQSIPFLRELPLKSVQKAIQKAAIHQYPANQIIFFENCSETNVFFLINGWIKLRTYDPSGKENILNYISCGEIFGETSALDSVLQPMDAVTATKANIAKICGNDFNELLNLEPLASLHLARSISKQLRQTNLRVRSLSASATYRVAEGIMFFVVRQKDNVWIPSQQQLGRFVGVSANEVSRILARLEKKKLIQLQRSGSIFVPDSLALKNAIEGFAG